MPQLTNKRRGEIQRKVLEVLLETPDGMQAKNVIAKVAKGLTLTAHESGEYPKHPGVRRFDKIVRFSTIGPVKAGWITKDKGIWKLNPAGAEVFKKISDAESLQAESARLYKVWKADQPEELDAEIEEASDSTTVEEAEETAWAEIRDFLANMNPFDFQGLVAGLLKGMGYHVAWVAPPGPDQGVDIVAHSDPLGVDGPRIKVQVKRTPNNKVPVETLRAFMSALGENDVGLFVAAGGFTSEAEKAARGQEKRRVTLLDLEGLFDLWVEHYAQIPDAEKNLLPLKFVPYLAPVS